jgi:thioredoxin 1
MKKSAALRKFALCLGTICPEELHTPSKETVKAGTPGSHLVPSPRVRSRHVNLRSALARTEGNSLNKGEFMATDTIIEVSDATFEKEVLQSNDPVLVDFWATWCGPCRALAPVIDEVAVAYRGRVRVVKLDVDANKDTAKSYGVQGIPTLIFFKDGVVKEQIVGNVCHEHLELALSKLLS